MSDYREYVKTSHKPVKTYAIDIQKFIDHDATNEGAVRFAFQRLLDDTAQKRGWVVIGEKSIRSTIGTRIQVDGAMENDFNIERGYWEAKDTHDNLDIEISKKIDKGYPLTNIIFEDTQTAVLFQDGAEVTRVPMREDKPGLVNLLNRFYNYTPPVIEQFERAVEQFSEFIPRLASELQKKIGEAHQKNKQFQTAFEDFYTICKEALNPNLRWEAVDEMLIQHMLTERLFRTVFNNPDFVRKNIIAREIEKVIDALTSKHFNRHDFVGELNQFYEAIENTAREQKDFAEKQAFLNTVYERFFQGYSVKQADTHGIVYTPQSIVDFMCASVEEVLKTEFDLSLGDEGVNILDPATGTGNFVVNLLRRIPKHKLKQAFTQQLFANEVMLLPYYIAALNIEHAYYELTGNYEPFEGIALVDTLDLKEKKQLAFDFFSEENSERIQRQLDTPITVIIGNPPYNVGQLNENDNNKNRTYRARKNDPNPGVDDRIEATYSTDSKATKKNALYDYVCQIFSLGYG